MRDAAAQVPLPHRLVIPHRRIRGSNEAATLPASVGIIQFHCLDYCAVQILYSHIVEDRKLRLETPCSICQQSDSLKEILHINGSVYSFSLSGSEGVQGEHV